MTFPGKKYTNGRNPNGYSNYTNSKLELINLFNKVKIAQINNLALLRNVVRCEECKSEEPLKLLRMPTVANSDLEIHCGIGKCQWKSTFINAGSSWMEKWKNEKEEATMDDNQLAVAIENVQSLMLDLELLNIASEGRDKISLPFSSSSNSNSKNYIEETAEIPNSPESCTPASAKESWADIMDV